MSDTKSVVTFTEMAKMLSLSRSRLYQLVASGVFPSPVYDVSTRRPIFTAELQMICLEVRRRNCGINGQVVLFYARGNRTLAKLTSKTKRKPTTEGQHDDLLDGLRALGLTAVTSEHVAAAVKEAFPQGIKGVDLGQVLRTVFLHIKRQETSGHQR
jgi:hypothetical protein